MVRLFPTLKYTSPVELAANNDATEIDVAVDEVDATTTPVEFDPLTVIDVAKVGDVVPTGPPVPLGVPVRRVATPVPSPLTPVEIGKPVQFVSVPVNGVPSAPPS